MSSNGCRTSNALRQSVALHRVAIKEEDLAPVPPTRPENTVTQEQNRRQQPVHGRRHFSPSQERGKLAQPKHNSYTTSGMKRRPKDSPTNATPTQPEDFTLPEYPYSGEAKDSRRVASK